MKKVTCKVSKVTCIHVHFVDMYNITEAVAIIHRLEMFILSKGITAATPLFYTDSCGVFVNNFNQEDADVIIKYLKDVEGLDIAE